MVVGARMSRFDGGAFRRFHVFGNRAISGLIAKLFGIRVTDVLSGYRAFSRDFVKTVPLSSTGFEIEMELTLQAFAKKFAIREVGISYGKLRSGSFSKLNTFNDGWIILKAIVTILDYKPLLFFLALSAIFVVCSLERFRSLFNNFATRKPIS